MMSEGDRFSRLRMAVKSAGMMNMADRREAAIAQVAANSLRFEKREVRETAINKYCYVDLGDSEVPVLVVSMHGHDPEKGEILAHLKRVPELTEKIDDYAAVLDEWIDLRKSVEGQEMFAKKYPDLFSALDKVGVAFDEMTDELAENAARLSGAGLIKIKKSRAYTDVNRKSFFRPNKLETNDDTLKFPYREWPTSVRAGFYGAMESVVRHKVGIDRKGKAKEKVAAIMVHGMINRSDADLIIAGGKIKEGEEVVLADQEVLMNFGKMLKEELKKRNVVLSFDIENGSETKHIEREPIVAIHQFGLGKNKALYFNGEEWVKGDRNEDGSRFSANGIGLDHFRSGAKLRVSKENGQTVGEGGRVMTMTGMGDNMNLIQLEIGAALRLDPQKMEIFSEALGAVAKRLFNKEDINDNGDDNVG